uniref:PDZ domain-containing protein n=1 Tax=Noctiluca scintillans TaxID=2966 RepID=A0A7S1AIR5_NOCSC|eukprot:CAMPEP_0194528174 /NCGR_PEP_ID=MMETSP0253-20130528/64517_1 /TAXON_ID=2966 /ORGANISM="Noctiluca scintillans" /LENGTH=138 /DNA_ID=CAMNT_0039373209 /DNA_START=65 /DNA_END=481 /DNA_ORIENTATION=+
MGSACCAQSDTDTAGEQNFSAAPFDENPGNQVSLTEASGNEVEEAPAGMIEVLVVRKDLKQKLGMDVKHVQSKLKIVAITDTGAVHFANMASAAKSPPGEMLKVGDTIVKVNDVNRSDTDMVEECSGKTELRITALRS